MDELNEPTFRPPSSQRGEGQPSPALRAHVGAGTSRGRPVDVMETMFSLFLWFFTLGTLNAIAKYTNAKANEVVWKKKRTGSNGKVFYQVMYVCTSMYACMYVDMNVHYVCMHVYASMHVCMFACMFACMCVDDDVCVIYTDELHCVTWWFHRAPLQAMVCTHGRRVTCLVRYNSQNGNPRSCSRLALLE